MLRSPSPSSASSLHDGQPVHLAHISDPHLTPPPIPRSAFIFNKRILSAWLWKKRRRHHLRSDISAALIKHIKSTSTPEALLISGDITNFGTREEYEASTTWLRSLPAPPIVVPGNHDAMIASSPEDSLNFWTEWSGETYPFVRFIGHVAIIGLNSAVPTLPFTAYGYLSADQLSKLDALLETLGQQGYCRVIMIHHPPKKGLVSWAKSLINTKKLARILKKRGAELVLHGHSHRATVTTVENLDIPLLGVGAASMSSHLLQKQASWNSLLFDRKEGKHCIHLTRYDYKGNVMAQKQWVTPIKRSV